MKTLNIVQRAGVAFGILHSAFCLLPDARAEIKVPVKDAIQQSPPPQAVPANVRVRVGGTVEIPLRVYGNETGVIKFKLRKQPRFGKVTAPRMVDRDAAVVTYENSGDPTHTRDTFSFAVQSDNGVSVPAEVTIAIFDDPPILAVPDEIKFGNVLVGSREMREVTLENRGGGVIEGTIEPPENWKVEGSANYRLGRGEKTTLRIVCVPQSEMPLRGDLKYSSHRDRVTTLRGDAQLPLAVTPQTVELKTAEGDSQRTGTFQISNRTHEALSMHIVAPERLEVAEQIEVPAGGEVSVPVKTARDDFDPVKEEIQIESADLKTQVAVQAPAVGPIIRASPPKLSLGTVDYEKPAGATLTVENIGGMPGYLRVEVEPPFAIASADAALLLDASEKREVHVTIHPSETGKIRAWLSIKSEQGVLYIPVEAEVRRRAAASFQPVASLNPNEAPSNEPTPPDPGAIVAQAGAAPPVSRTLLKSVTNKSAELEWQVPSDEKLQYKIESEQLSRDAKGALNVHWIPLANVTIKQSGKTVSATLRKLAPNSFYVVRVVSINPQGEPIRLASEVHFQTRAHLSWLLLSPLKILFAVLAALLALILRQRFFSNQKPKARGA